MAELGDYQGAHEKFLLALDKDPSYTRAQRRADSLVPILAAMASSDGSEGSPGE